jgi:16S rRNA (uracil1498-N3)-methyltransferase
VIELDDSEAHHLIHVLRLQAGDRIELFDGMGGLSEATVADVGRKTAAAEILNIERVNPRQGGRVIIATSSAKGQRFDWLIAKCTELGVDELAVVLFERTVKQPQGPAAMQRYQKLTVSAAKQCGRLFLPRLSGPAGLAETVKDLTARYRQTQMIFGGFGEGAVGIGQYCRADADTIAFVGPEGGMTDAEEQLLSEQGATPVRINANILRVETAAIAFAAILCADR